MTETTELYTVKEAAKRLKISRSTIRNYAALLDPPPFTLCTGERLFTTEHVEQMREIRKAKKR